MTAVTAVVVGAGRGLGRGIARAFADAGATVVAVARTDTDLAAVVADGGAVRAEPADATDPYIAGSLLRREIPQVLVLVAGAVPVMASLHDQTWDSFSVNWHTDVKLTFEWLRAALIAPLAPGSRIVVVSSGAAIHGSPASGGYAGAKSTQRFLARYAQEESDRLGMGLVVTTVLPAMTPLGAVGRAGVRGYAERAGVTEDEFLARQPAPLTPEGAGAAIEELTRTDPATLATEYLLTSAGARPLT